MVRFERGLDPKKAMDIGLKHKAPIVGELFLLETNPAWKGSPSGDKYYLKLQDIQQTLEYIVNNPGLVHRYHVEFTDKTGTINSGRSSLTLFENEYVQYQDKLYLIPENEF
jgi:hypothetical protein